jgi:hypothetical protein
MTLINTMAASVVGALMLSSGALGLGRSLTQKQEKPTSTNVSSAKCMVIATGYSEGKNQELTVSAGTQSSAYVFSLPQLRRFT